MPYRLECQDCRFNELVVDIDRAIEAERRHRERTEGFHSVEWDLIR